MVKRGKRRKLNNFVIFFIILIFTIILVGSVVWNSPIDDFYGNEDVLYYYNVSTNVSNIVGNLVIGITYSSDGNLSVVWDNGTENKTYMDLSSLPWIKYNSSNFILTLNITNDNQTGRYTIPFLAKDDVEKDGINKRIYFVINATNDAPFFTFVNDTYIFPTKESPPVNYLNGSDEESHYPLSFFVNFLPNNCTHASWSGFNDNENCSLHDFGFSIVQLSNTSAKMTLPLNKSLAGVYYANVSVMDNVRFCPHQYCDNSTYYVNKTTYYSKIVRFEVESFLEFNVSSCDNYYVVEGNPINCYVEIYTKREVDPLNISSYGSWRSGSWSYYPDRRDWFYKKTSNFSSNYFFNVSINSVPTKREVGNWTINFSVSDGIVVVSEPIRVFVNYTESLPYLESIDDVVAYENKEFIIKGYDLDLLILDKSVKNENLTFNSNTSWVKVTKIPHSVGNNYTSANVFINQTYALNNLGVGNYTIRINLTDSVGNYNETFFVVSIGNNSAPLWNSSFYRFFYNETDRVFLNLTNGYVLDSDEDELIFYYQTISGNMSSFNLSSSGVINFSADDFDVGNHSVRIIASDRKVNSSAIFNFTIYNINDNVSIINIPSVFNTSENNLTHISVIVKDSDYLIKQKSFYNEQVNVTLLFYDLNKSSYITPFFNFSLSDVSGEYLTFLATFKPNKSQVGVYNITFNATDRSNSSDVKSFILNITEVNNPPNLTFVPNMTYTIYDSIYYVFEASDIEEDMKGPSLRNLTFEIKNLTVGGNFINSSNFDSSTGVLNISNLSLYKGRWRYNVSVYDSQGNSSSQVFWIHIYGKPTLISPSQGFVFNLEENSTNYLQFLVNESIGDNMTYEFWIDNIFCEFQDKSNCSYEQISLRDSLNYLGNGTSLNKTLRTSFLDETYGNLKNLTLVVYPNTNNLNNSQRNSLKESFNFKLNISHKNHPTEIIAGLGSYSSTYGQSSPITIYLDSHFLDYDYIDSYYKQNITFRIISNTTNSIVRANSYNIANQLPFEGIFENWTLYLYASDPGVEKLKIIANDSYSSVSTDWFIVTFNVPSVSEKQIRDSSGGGTTTRQVEKEVLKYFSLKIVTPLEIIIDEKNYIEIPFSIINTGQVDLFGINLSSSVLFNDEYSQDVRISLGQDYIPELKFGESKNFTMRIIANTQKSGRYKATIYANVTSPRFDDWGDFFIELKRVNETEAEKLLIFTEKFITENPDCLELKENLKEAKALFDGGDYALAMSLSEKIITACEDLIRVNEQTRYGLEGIVQKNFFNVFVFTILSVFLGIVFYFYKRVRFNKSKMRDYI